MKKDNMFIVNTREILLWQQRYHLSLLYMWNAMMVRYDEISFSELDTWHKSSLNHEIEAISQTKNQSTADSYTATLYDKWRQFSGTTAVDVKSQIIRTNYQKDDKNTIFKLDSKTHNYVLVSALTKSVHSVIEC